MSESGKRGEGVAAAAIQDALCTELAYCKFLSATDSGVNRSNQGGILVGKAGASLLFDGPVEKSEQIVERALQVRWQGEPQIGATGKYFPSKREYRLTALGQHPRSLLDAGDLLVLTTRPTPGALNAWVLKTDDDIQEFLGWFSLSPIETNQIIVTGGASRIPSTEQVLIDAWVAGLALGWPTRAQVSNAARDIHERLHPKVDPLVDPDKTVLAWCGLEYRMFQALEYSRYSWIARPFATVDDFLVKAHEVSNRRKSRAGYSLENHLAELFRLAGLPHAHNPVLGVSVKPDFIFPSAVEYSDPDYPGSGLRFLGAKTTCKDRWRQILAEDPDKRIPNKHLFTLQAGMSSAQLTEMRDSGVTLVAPLANHASFPKEHQKDVLSLKRFIDETHEVMAARTAMLVADFAP